ncbi:MAG: head-tail connector protein [Litoreibacter sp.]
MMLEDLTTLASADLPIGAFRAHLRLGSGFTDDSLQDELLENYLRASLATIEARIGKVLLRRDFEWTLTRWSSDQEQPLPLAPVNTVTSVVRTDSSGAQTVIDPATYVLLPDTHRPKIVAKAGCFAQPIIGGTLSIQFSAGFGISWEAVPSDLRQAVMLLASHYYEYRTDTSGVSGLIPNGVKDLLETYRVIRTFGGRQR